MKVTLRAVFDYMQANEPKFGGMEWSLAEQVFGWYRHFGLLLVLADEEGRVTGVAGIRRVDTPEQGSVAYVHDDKAPLLWVDWVGADSPLHMASLLDGVEARWPDNKPVEIHGTKARHGDIPRVLNFQTFIRKLRHIQPIEKETPHGKTA